MSLLNDVANEQPVQIPTERFVVDDPEAGVGWGTDWNLARADDDIELQRRIVAKEVGVPLESVISTPQGIAYRQGDNMVLAQPSGFLNRTAEFTADMLADPGAMIGAGVGALTSPVTGMAGPVIGAGLGDIAQTGVEDLLEDRNTRSPADYASGAATESALAAGGELAYRGGKSLLRGGKNWLTGADNFDQVELDKAWALSQRAKDRGIPLTPAEATGNRELLNTQSWLRDVPNSASTQVDDFLASRHPKIERAVEEYVGPKSPQQVFADVVNGMAGSRAKMVKDRSEVVSPYYQAAGNTVADVRPVIENLYTRIEATEGTKIGNSLKRAFKGVTRMNGKERMPKELISELHYAKLDLDDMIEAATRKGNGNAVHELMKVKDDLLEVIEDASTDYKAGREKFIEMSKPINEFDEGLPGALVKEGERHSPNLGRVLFGPTSSPQAVVHARRTIGNDDLFTDMTLGHLKNEFGKLNSSSIGEVTNVGGLFYKSVFGSQNKRAMLKAALPEDQYAALQDFMEILGATGRGFKGQSTTAQRQMMNERSLPMGIRPFSAAHNAYQQHGYDKVTQNLSRLITNDYTQTQLAKAANDIRKFGRMETPQAQQKYADAVAAGVAIMFGNTVETE